MDKKRVDKFLRWFEDQSSPRISYPVAFVDMLGGDRLRALMLQCLMTLSNEARGAEFRINWNELWARWRIPQRTGRRILRQFVSLELLILRRKRVGATNEVATFCRIRAEKVTLLWEEWAGMQIGH